jgi:hypothetical protein
MFVRKRRHAGQSLVRLFQGPTDVIERELGEQIRCQPEIPVRFDTLEHAVSSDVLDDWELLRFRDIELAAREPIGELVEPMLEVLETDRPPKHEVRNVIAEIRNFTGRTGMSPPHGYIEPEGMFGREVGVADLERKVARMRPEVEQLLEGGDAGRARQTHRKGESLVRCCRREEQSDRPRSGREAPLALTIGRVPRMIDAPPKLERDVRPRDLLKHKRRSAPLIDIRGQGLCAAGAERTVQEPSSELSFDASKWLMTGHQLDFFGVVRE